MAFKMKAHFHRYDFVFVDQSGLGKHTPNTFAALAASFTEYKNQP
jgi:hypothetical protein